MFTNLQFNKILTNLLVSPKQISAEKFPFFFKTISTKYIKNVFALTYQFHRFLLLVFLLVKQSLKKKRLNFLLITSETSFIVEYTDFVFKQKKLNLNLTTISQAKHLYFNTNFDFVLFCGNVVKKNEFILKFFKSIQKPVLGLVTYPSSIEYFDFYHLVENRQIELAYLVHIIFFYLNILVKKAKSENFKIKKMTQKQRNLKSKKSKFKKLDSGNFIITPKYYKSLHKFIKLRATKSPVRLKPILLKRNLNVFYKQPRKLKYLLKRLPKLRRKNLSKFKLFRKTSRGNLILFYKRWIAAGQMKKKILSLNSKRSTKKLVLFSQRGKTLMLRALIRYLTQLKKKHVIFEQKQMKLQSKKPHSRFLKNKMKKNLKPRALKQQKFSRGLIKSLRVGSFKNRKSNKLFNKKPKAMNLFFILNHRHKVRISKLPIPTLRNRFF